jgi:putative heme-binding domain-containing protein
VEQLVADLGHANVWQRERAMKLLLAGRMTNALPLLMKELPALPTDGQSEFFHEALRESEFARRNVTSLKVVNAMNMLRALLRAEARMLSGENARPLAQAIGRELLRRTIIATVNTDPGVRTAAWRSLQGLASQPSGLPDGVLKIWSNDPNPAVRFHVALALGNWESDGATRALMRIGLRDGEDKWTRAAFLSGFRGRTPALLEHIIPEEAKAPSPTLGYEIGLYLGRLLGGTILKNKTPASLSAQWADSEASWHLATLGGYITAVGLKELKATGDLNLKRFGYNDEAVTEIRLRARQLLDDAKSDLLVKQSAIAVLALAPEDGGQELLEQIKHGHAPEVLRHLLSLTIELGQLDALEQLTSEPLWSSLNPTARSQVIDGLLQREATAGLLLRSLQAGRVQPSALSLNQRERLQRQLPAGLKEEAARLFTAVGGDRMQVYEQFKDVAAMKGDASKGRELFQLHCAACHRLDRAGFNVGPDLFGIRSQPKEAILLHVLVPNAEVYPEFAAVTLETRDDRSLTGIVRAETADAITLVQAQGLVTTLRRDEITSRRTADTSLMPDGFEQVLSRQELADLLAGLRGE